MTSSERPRYLEAYPRLNMVSAKAATEDGREVCEFANQSRQAIGLARFGDMTANHIVLEYDIAQRNLPHACSAIRLDTVLTPNGVDGCRTITRCPSCMKKTIVLIYVESWACSKCHRLVHRSQTMDTNTRLFEKRNALRKVLSRGRPKGMQRATFLKFCAKRDNLTARLKGQVDFSDESQRGQIIDTIWRTHEPYDSLFFLQEMDADNF